MRFFAQKSFPHFKQADRFDCGPTCLKIISKFYGRNFSREHLRDICGITTDGTTIKSLITGAEKLGFQTATALISYDVLDKKAPLPCIVYWRNRHFVIVYKIKNDTVYISDPSFGLLKYKKSEFRAAWQNNDKADEVTEGVVLLMEPSTKFHESEDTDFSKGLKSILPYLTNYYRYIFQIFIGLIVGSVIELILPFLTQKIVDKGINLGQIKFVYILVLAQLMLFFSLAFISIIRGWLLLFVGARVNMLIASDYLIKLLSKTVSFFDSKSPGDIMQRINESSRLENFLVQVPNAAFTYLNSVVFLLALLYYSLTIFAIFSVGIIAYIIWIQVFMKRREELDYKRFNASAGMSSKLIQIVGGIQEVKVNGSESKHIKDWERVRVNYFKTSVSGLKLSQLQETGGNVINEIKNVLVTLTAAVLVIEGKITLGSMLAIQYIVGQINGPLINLLNFLRVIQDAKLSIDRFNDIDHTTEEQRIINDSTLLTLPKGTYDISIRNLNFSYTKSADNLVLKNINLRIPKGKVTAIVGESGSGKTTLLKLLLKLYLPTSGDIYVGNHNLQHITSGSWRELCGTVMQDGFIFSDTITQNIIESTNDYGVDIERLLKAAELSNIEGLINSLPGGFNSQISAAGSSGRTLSGGQKQRILIARAIYKNPEFLFFDEATSALDASNEKTITDNLAKFAVGKTVVVIAHRLSTVKSADQIVVLKNGKIEEIGLHEGLVDRKGYYHELIKNQLELDTR
jgi:ATP-binding cassette subfamily B protein